MDITNQKCKTLFEAYAALYVEFPWLYIRANGYPLLHNLSWVFVAWPLDLFQKLQPCDSKNTFFSFRFVLLLETDKLEHLYWLALRSIVDQ